MAEHRDRAASTPSKPTAKGEYFSLGIQLGHYKVTLIGTDGKEIFHYNGFTAGSDESTLDFDMKKEQPLPRRERG